MRTQLLQTHSLPQAAGPMPWKACWKTDGDVGFVPMPYSLIGMAQRVRDAAPVATTDGVSRSLPVLQISADARLARTREMVLQHAGIVVTTQDAMLARTPSPEAAGRLMLLCQSISPLQAAEISAHAHEHHACRILRTTQSPEEEFGDFEAMLVAPVHPLHLVREIVRMGLAPEDIPLGDYTS